MKEKESLMQKMQKRVFGKSTEHLKKYPDRIEAKENAPVMGFERELKVKSTGKMFVSRIKMFFGKTMFSLFRETRKVKKTLKKNPQEPKNSASNDF